MTIEAREKIIRRDEFAAGEAKGRTEGRTEGEAKGIADTLRKIIQTNFDKGRSVEEIADITGESVDSIREIVEKSK